MRKLMVIVILAFFSDAYAQKLPAENLVVITLDGFRWQEVFGGADSQLIRTEKYTPDTADMIRQYWAATGKERREKLWPFLWKQAARLGVFYGNRWLGSTVDNANPHWFSYPGYNELFTGFPDSLVNSNDKIPNRHINVLEFLHQQPGYRGKVAAFTSWDVFPWILNEQRSGFPVNSGFEKINPENNTVLQTLNEMQFTTYRPLGDGVRPDLLTYFTARQYLRMYKPRVLYIGFDETDDLAHGGKYDLYLQAAAMTDRLIEDLWRYLQADPQYRNKTALLITSDHGRGDMNKDQWRDHGAKIADAHQIWFFLMGPGVNERGEMRSHAPITQSQLAATMAQLLGFRFVTDHPVSSPVPLQ